MVLLKNPFCEKCCDEEKDVKKSYAEEHRALPSKDTIIEIQDMSFGYEKEVNVIEDISLKIFRGDFVLIYGPNGAGKSTLVKLILGIEKPTKGKVLLYGYDSASDKGHVYRKISYLSQRIGYNDNESYYLTVMDVVLSGFLVNFKEPILFYSPSQYNKAEHLMKHLEIYEIRNKRLTELSLGLKQRAYLARALVSDPEILILDEPTIGVDQKTNTIFMNYLKHLNEVHNITILLVSHDFEQVIDYVKSVLYLNNKIVFYCDKERAKTMLAKNRYF
ncbi:MAG: ATP-binding cassette domain-containing protein [Candidatus Micrarchaeota archaeon]|nr:ATP-binding cassette domain-containing protein [Candidatus Micrarchaeota archaeon]